MDKFDKELLLWIESLLSSYKRFVDDCEDTPEEEKLVNGLRGLVNLANMVLRDVPVFGIEPWHVIGKNPPLAAPGEMLLRLKDYKGNAMPPYPFVMAFYEYGFTPHLDMILVLAALRQFDKDPSEKQVSINVSSRSLRDPNFVKTILARLEVMRLHERGDECVIFEIHESTHNLIMSRQVLDLFRRVGCLFALDDVGLSMNDIMRLTEFEGIADYIKIDRHSVLADPASPNSMSNIIAYVRNMLPGSILIAEGVQNAEHAKQVVDVHPDILYAQGLYLPEDRNVFQREYLALSNAKMAAQKQTS